MRDLMMVRNARLRTNLWPLQCAEQAQLRNHYAAKIAAAQLTMRPAQAAAEITRLMSERDAGLGQLRARHSAERTLARLFVSKAIKYSNRRVTRLSVLNDRTPAPRLLAIRRTRRRLGMTSDFLPHGV